MDTETKICRSLPPLVEGKIHGYLKLVIDEFIWLKRSPGEIKVFASWWGESDSALFRPADIIKSDTRAENETSEIYAIRTNISLFKEYIKNCDSIELVIISDRTNAVIGTSQITDLLDIFQVKPYFKYFPILDDHGNNIGEIHVSIKLLHMTKPSNMQLKTYKCEKKQLDDKTIFSSSKSDKDTAGDKGNTYERSKINENDVYKSILRAKRTDLKEPLKKFNSEVTDKLVAQVVARAQRLRGAILKETYNEDPLALSDTSLSNGLQSFTSGENEAKLYEYVLGKDMTSFDEHRALNTLRSTSPTLSLIDLAAKSIEDHQNYDKNSMSSNMPFTKATCPIQEISSEEKPHSNTKESLLLNHVDCIRIFVESFVLNPAGYRRVKSSSLSRNDNKPLSVTYFVQYDTPFGHCKQTTGKSTKENRSIRIPSKKQADQVIYFNHDGMYSISKSKLHADSSIKFKIFVRHLNQKSPTELGIGSMSIGDITNTDNWSITQHLAIVNKGIKIGELHVTAELGSDFTHFGKQYVDDIISTKENIPVLEMHSLLNKDNNKKSKTATGTQSKTSSRVSSASTKEVNCLTDNNTDFLTARDRAQQRKESMDDKRIDAKSQQISSKEEILLHGLIYVAEGKELPESSTYLICRAFWREDKSTSQVCNNTKNPFYHFCQLVPLIHGSDLLNRIKDNYIIIEVYCKNNNADNLLGLAKLSVHQLYVAYRDPHVLPHLLLSKYPVISVDGWVPITNPVTGKSCGQLLALVALGTVEQITFLEMSRGLRSVNAIPRSVCTYPQSFPDHAKYLQNVQETSKCNAFELQSSMGVFPQDNTSTFTLYTANAAEKESHLSNLKTQESQTDISAIKESKLDKALQGETFNSEHVILHSLVDRLAQALTINKKNIDQEAQTDMNLEEEKQTDTRETCSNELNLNNISDDSDSISLRNNFHLPPEMYRSVGVGAEYTEDLDQQSNTVCSNTVYDVPTVSPHTEREQTDSNRVQETFRAIIEIECALHLPEIEKNNESVKPSTYVSFQANKSDSTEQLDSYLVTDVFPHSCNPKWNWKYDATLPTDLLLDTEKRLILKTWRVLDSDISMQINLERDIVIGFSAIDLSLLITGFPTVSGWFHIIDFTGKCNGQIKVCVTPLDNLTSFVKPLSTLSTTRMPTSNVSPLTWSPTYYEERTVDRDAVGKTNVNCMLSTFPSEENKSTHSESQVNNVIPSVDYGFEDVSMSFLSLSLKQKLTELDEITKRLESRLHDVTSTAFDDDFENEFDVNEPISDHENNDGRNTDTAVYAATSQNGVCQIPQINKKSLHDKETIENRSQTCRAKSDTRSHLTESHINTNRPTNYEAANGGPSKASSSYARQNLVNDNYHVQNNEYSAETRRPRDISADYPVRGTKTHINHLLDKLSLQLPVQSLPTSRSMPMRRNVIDLLSNLRQNNNNIQANSKCNQELKVCSMPTQTDNENERTIGNFEGQTTNRSIIGTYDENNDKSLSEASVKSQANNRVSTVIREELIAEENNDTSKCDELSTYLITSNVRHMDLDSIFNPLLYPHLIPDLHLSSTASPEGEAIEKLDSRYTTAFSTSIDNRLNKVHNTTEIANETNSQAGQHKNMLDSPEDTELFRVTPSGVSENVDGNIDLTVIHKSSYNDLTASNSTESTTTLSPGKLSMKQTEAETTENGYSTSSEISVPVLSRQAPDGGNPIEDVVKPSVTQKQDDSQSSSLSS